MLYIKLDQTDGVKMEEKVMSIRYWKKWIAGFLCVALTFSNTLSVGVQVNAAEIETGILDENENSEEENTEEVTDDISGKENEEEIEQREEETEKPEENTVDTNDTEEKEDGEEENGSENEGDGEINIDTEELQVGCSLKFSLLSVGNVINTVDDIAVFWQVSNAGTGEDCDIDLPKGLPRG